jgi:fatty-acyl-CoA synthase
MVSLRGPGSHAPGRLHSNQGSVQGYHYLRGENISSVEVENILAKHPEVSLVAVVARQHEKWGETPCAFIELNRGYENTSAAELIDFCRDNMAGFKRPKNILFCELPKTSTGKIQKFELRKRARKM